VNRETGHGISMDYIRFVQVLDGARGRHASPRRPRDDNRPRWATLEATMDRG
jgi:hypothetical protein